MKTKEKTKSKSTTKVKKDISPMILDIASKLVNGINNEKTEGEKEVDTSRQVIITLTDKVENFDLWTYNEIRPVNKNIFMGRLSGNLVNAIMQANEMYPNHIIKLDKGNELGKHRSEKWKILTFGPHRNKHIDDVVVTDLKYVKTLLNDIISEKEHESSKLKKSRKKSFDVYDESKWDDWKVRRIYTLSSDDQLFHDLPFSSSSSKKPQGKNRLMEYIYSIKDEIDEMWKDIASVEAEKIANRNGKQFIGTVGEIFDFTLVVRNIIKKDGFNVYIMTDNRGNKVIKKGFINSRFIIQKGSKKSKYLRAGDTVNFKSYVDKHVLDVKYKIGDRLTYLRGDITELNPKK